MWRTSYPSIPLPAPARFHFPQHPPPADLPAESLRAETEVRPGEDDEEADRTRRGNLPEVGIMVLQGGELGKVLRVN